MDCEDYDAAKALKRHIDALRSGGMQPLVAPPSPLPLEDRPLRASAASSSSPTLEPGQAQHGPTAAAEAGNLQDRNGLAGASAGLVARGYREPMVPSMVAAPCALPGERVVP